MTLQESIQLLESQGERSLASIKDLRKAADLIASKIIDAVPSAIDLPRNYRVLQTTHTYANSRCHSWILAAYTGGGGNATWSEECALNEFAFRQMGDGWQDAPRPVLLKFAQDIADGFLSEITSKLAEYAESNESASKMLQA